MKNRIDRSKASKKCLLWFWKHNLCTYNQFIDWNVIEWAVCSSEVFFKIELICFWILWYHKYIVLVMKMNNFRGGLTDILAEMATLVCRYWVCWWTGWLIWRAQSMRRYRYRYRIPQLQEQNQDALIWSHNDFFSPRSNVFVSPPRRLRWPGISDFVFKFQLNIFGILLQKVNSCNESNLFSGWPSRCIGCNGNTA